MSKILAGTCEEGKVYFGEFEVEGAVILSEGEGASTGVIILDEGAVYYVADTTPDLKATLEKLITALDEIADGLDSLDSAGFLIGATGGVPSPPIITANVTAIETAKTNLETLKGMLR